MHSSVDEDISELNQVHTSGIRKRPITNSNTNSNATLNQHQHTAKEQRLPTRYSISTSSSQRRKHAWEAFSLPVSESEHENIKEEQQPWGSSSPSSRKRKVSIPKPESESDDDNINIIDNVLKPTTKVEKGVESQSDTKVITEIDNLINVQEADTYTSNSNSISISTPSPPSHPHWSYVLKQANIFNRLQPRKLADGIFDENVKKRWRAINQQKRGRNRTKKRSTIQEETRHSSVIPMNQRSVIPVNQRTNTTSSGKGGLVLTSDQCAGLWQLVQTHILLKNDSTHIDHSSSLSNSSTSNRSSDMYDHDDDPSTIVLSKTKASNQKNNLAELTESFIRAYLKDNDIVPNENNNSRAIDYTETKTSLVDEDGGDVGGTGGRLLSSEVILSDNDSAAIKLSKSSSSSSSSGKVTNSFSSRQQALLSYDIRDLRFVLFHAVIFCNGYGDDTDSPFDFMPGCTITYSPIYTITRGRSSTLSSVKKAIAKRVESRTKNEIERKVCYMRNVGGDTNSRATDHDARSRGQQSESTNDDDAASDNSDSDLSIESLSTKNIKPSNTSTTSTFSYYLLNSALMPVITSLPSYYSNWALLWSDIFTFCFRSRILRSIKKMMVFNVKKLFLDSEITSLEFNIFKDQSSTQLKQSKVAHSKLTVQVLEADERILRSSLSLQLFQLDS